MTLHTTDNVIRVMVVDDHPIVREGLGLLFEHKEDLEICGEADSAENALAQLEHAKPDIIIVDITLKDSNGLDLIKSIKTIDPNMPVLVLSVHDESVYAERALRAGARGYIMKEELTENVVTAIRRIVSGKIYVSARLSELLLDKLTGNAPPIDASPIDLLSDRELQVFQMLGKGQTTKEIAEGMHVSPKTIQSYKSRIKEKLNIETTSELLQMAFRWTNEGI